MVINVKPGVVTFGISDDQVYTYDAEGRLLYAYHQGRSYRRGLDGRWMEKWHERTSTGRWVRRRRWLTPAEQSDLIDLFRSHLRDTVAPALKKHQIQILWNTPDMTEADILHLTQKIIETDLDALQRDVQRFHEIYTPIGILPPDQYLAMVIQVTHGCHWNQCLFCDFYAKIPFQIRPIADLVAHIEAVLAYLGKSLPLRRSVFLSDANALMVPEAHIREVFRVLNDHIPPRHPRFAGYYSFLDTFTGIRRSKQLWQELAKQGLRRVYLGIETGHPELLQWLNKPGSPEDARRLIFTLKEAGVHIGLIILVGAGGKKFREVHLRDTIKFIRSVPLARGDLVYLSEFQEPHKPAYRERLEQDGIEPMTDEEIWEDIERLKRELQGHGFQVSLYNIEEFLY